MTLTEEQIAEIRARAEAATPGPWAYESVSEKSNDYCIGTVCPVDKDGDPGDPIMGNVRHHPHYFNAETGDFGEWYYEMVCSIDECEHGGDGSLHADARFIAHARDDIPALLSALEAANKRADEAEALVETLKHEAQIHAQEARTANATIAEIYREVSGGKGEPGNWNGAEPVRAELTALRARVAELEAVVVKLREAIKRFAEVAEWDIGDNESDSDTYHPMDPRYSVSGNISIGHLRRAHEVMEETDWIADKIRAQQTNDAALKGTTHEQG